MNGIASFSALQAALGAREGPGHKAAHEAVFYAFDLLHLNGLDLQPAPLLKRKEALVELTGRFAGAIRYSEHLTGDGEPFSASPASWAWRALSPSEPIDHIAPAEARTGSRSNASRARSSSLPAMCRGPTARRASAPSCSATMRASGSPMPAGSGPVSRPTRPAPCGSSCNRSASKNARSPSGCRASPAKASSGRSLSSSPR